MDNILNSITVIKGKAKDSNKYEKDVSCPKCYDSLSEDKKNRSRERTKQILLSEQHNRPYPYRDLTIETYLQHQQLIVP